ncbi:MAG TPA: MFS transporter [Thermoplasmata archaeon]|nr:MFS transporter [Thermoplasmata archaeon]
MSDSGLPPPESPARVLSARRAAGVLGALLMALLLGALDNFVVVTALPTIATDLNDVNGVVFVVSSYLIAQTIAIPVFGKLSDRYGRRSFFLLGLGIFLVGSALSGLSQNLNELIGFRAIQGLGSGAFFTVVFSIVADIFPPKAAARLAGILSGVFGIAIVFGPLIGSYIVDTTTWRWIFFVNLPIGFAAVLLVLLSMRALPASRSPTRFDSPGMVLLSLWVGALIFALVETSNGWAWTDARTLGLLATAVVVFPLFLWWEARAGDPLLPLRFFRIPVVAASSSVNFLRGAVLTVVVTFVPILVQKGLGGSPDLGRDVLYAFMIPMIAGAAVGGQLVARSGYRVPVTIGLAFTTLGVYLLTLVSSQPPILRFYDGLLPVGLAGALVPLGIGVGLTFAPTQLSIQYAVPRKDVGTGNSLVWFISNLGGSIVVSILASYQLTVFTSLRPAGAPPAVTDPGFLPWLLATQSAVATSIHDVWWLLLPLAVAGLVSAVLVSGRLPTTSALEEAQTAAPSPNLM